MKIKLLTGVKWPHWMFCLLLVFCFYLLPNNAYAQDNIEVSGKITSSSGGVLPGASIIQKGGNAVTISNEAGEYAITVPDDATLVVSSLGYNTEEVAVNGNNVINVTLTSTTSKLEEVVVVGYGEMKSENVSGSQVGIKSQDFERQPITDINEAIMGRMSGVRMERTNAQPGSGFKMRIRGVNSIQGNNNALILVDGVESAAHVDPNNIASVEVLKDASATALYGSRGANGVVLITTKSGTSDKPTIGLDANVGFQWVPRKMPVMNPLDFARTINDSRTEVGGTAPFSDAQIDDIAKNGGTDWQKAVFNDGAPVQHYNLSINKGGPDDAVSYYVAGNYEQNKGVTIGPKFERFGLVSKLDFKFNEKFKAGLNIRGDRSRRWGHKAANVGFFVAYDPTYPLQFDENGDLAMKAPFASLHMNPYIEHLNSHQEDIGTRIDASVYGDYKITDDLTLNIFGSMSKGETNNGNYVNILIDSRGHGVTSNGNSMTLLNTNRLTYEKNFNADHYLHVDAIVEQRYTDSKSNEMDGKDFLSDALGFRGMPLAGTITPTQSFVSDKLLSYLGRIQYMYRDKYIVTLAGRQDGSSKFRKGHQWGFFPSAALAWKMDKEGFMENSDFFDQFKWRVSYGETGSQAIAALATRARLTGGLDAGFDLTDAGINSIGVAPTTVLNNPLLTWETTQQFNVGIDLSMLNSRLTFTGDIYNKKTTDLLMDVKVPIFTGADKVTRNMGAMQNKGFEFTLGGTPVLNDDWRVNLSVNFSLNKNKILELSGEDRIDGGNTYSRTGGISPSWLVVGQPIGTFVGYDFAGIWQEDEAAEAANYGSQPGDAKYRDVNNSGSITGDDIIDLGSPFPDFTYGFNGDISFKDFDLSFLFVGQQGGKVYNLVKADLLGLGGATKDPVADWVLDRWSPTNTGSLIPAFTKTSSTEVLSSQFIEDVTFFRLANLSLGYNFSPKIFHNTPISSLRLFISTQNLFTLHKKEFTGFDPGMMSSTADKTFGIYNAMAAYPTPRMVTFGVNVKF